MRLPHCVAIFYNLPWFCSINKKLQRNAENACGNRMCKRVFCYTLFLHQAKTSKLFCHFVLRQYLEKSNHQSGVCFNVSFYLTLFGQCVLRVLAIFDGMFQQNCCTFEVGTLKSRYCVLLKFYYLPKICL